MLVPKQGTSTRADAGASAATRECLRQQPDETRLELGGASCREGDDDARLTLAVRPKRPGIVCAGCREESTAVCSPRRRRAFRVSSSGRGLSRVLTGPTIRNTKTWRSHWSHRQEQDGCLGESLTGHGAKRPSKRKPPLRGGLVSWAWPIFRLSIPDVLTAFSLGLAFSPQFRPAFLLGGSNRRSARSGDAFALAGCLWTARARLG